MKNAEWIINRGINLNELTVEREGAVFNIYDPFSDEPIGSYPTLGNYLTSDVALLRWLDEEYDREPEPLTYEEVVYLYDIVAPLKSQVRDIMISIQNEDAEYEFLLISYHEWNGHYQGMSFPSFRRGTMYKGMKRKKDYTLEELGID